MNTKKLIRKIFREQVFLRDSNKCKICNNLAIDAHHITDRSLMPNGGYVIENGISLCENCHMKAEEFHISDGKNWYKDMYPDDLYRLINSSEKLAIDKSKLL